jgi:hypothetical protein
MLAGDVDPKSSMQSVSSESRDLISWARLLERRVSFARWAAAESCAVLSDEPKNFIKLCATNAAGGRGRLVHSLTASPAEDDRGGNYLPSLGFAFTATVEPPPAAADALAAGAGLAPPVFVMSF